MMLSQRRAENVTRSQGTFGELVLSLSPFLFPFLVRALTPFEIKKKRGIEVPRYDSHYGPMLLS